MTDVDLTPNQDNVVLLSVVRKQFKLNQCEHKIIVIDNILNEVECEACGVKLNPVAVLERFATEQTAWERLLRDRSVLEERINKKSRCKCQHCGQMTYIGKV